MAQCQTELILMQESFQHIKLSLLNFGDMLDPNMWTTLCKGQFKRQTFFSDDHDMLGKEYIEGQDLADFIIIIIMFGGR
jgi:hypothetical protein